MCRTDGGEPRRGWTRRGPGSSVPEFLWVSAPFLVKSTKVCLFGDSCPESRAFGSERADRNQSFSHGDGRRTQGIRDAAGLTVEPCRKRSTNPSFVDGSLSTLK